MIAFVTGGTGFVGSHLIEALLARGDTVRGLVRDPAKAHRIFGPDRANLDLIPGTLSDDGALLRGATGVDIVFHVAGLTAARSRAELFDINERATGRVAAHARTAGAHVVLVSSLAAAGPSTPGRRSLEGDPPHPVTEYGESKLAGELALRAAGGQWTIVRPPTVYGPRDVELLRVFRLARSGILPLFGDGSQLLSVVFVEDLARALIAAATPVGVGKTYFAAHTDIVTSRNLATAIHRAVRPGAAAPLIVPVPGALARPMLWLTGTAARLANQATLLSADKANEFLATAWTCSPAALTADTGWAATVNLDAGIARTAAWYRANGRL